MTETEMKILAYGLMIAWIVVVFFWNFKEVLKDKYTEEGMVLASTNIMNSRLMNERKNPVITLSQRYEINEHMQDQMYLPKDVIRARHIEDSQDAILEEARKYIVTKEYEDYNRPPWIKRFESRLLIADIKKDRI